MFITILYLNLFKLFLELFSNLKDYILKHLDRSERGKKYTYNENAELIRIFKRKNDTNK